jgi:hypothetical protein
MPQSTPDPSADAPQFRYRNGETVSEWMAVAQVKEDAVLGLLTTQGAVQQFGQERWVPAIQVRGLFPMPARNVSYSFDLPEIRFSTLKEAIGAFLGAEFSLFHFGRFVPINSRNSSESSHGDYTGEYKERSGGWSGFFNLPDYEARRSFSRWQLTAVGADHFECNSREVKEPFTRRLIPYASVVDLKISQKEWKPSEQAELESKIEETENELEVASGLTNEWIAKAAKSDVEKARRKLIDYMERRKRYLNGRTPAVPVLTSIEILVSQGF